jgi:hypothetical protein
MEERQAHTETSMDDLQLQSSKDCIVLKGKGVGVHKGKLALTTFQSL